MPVQPFLRWLRLSSLTLYRLVTWTILGAGLAFAVTVLALRYWVLPNIDRYRDAIAEAVSETVNQRIAIGRVSGNWDGLRPELVLEDVTVLDAGGRPALKLSRIENTLSWLSVAALEPRFRSIEIHRPALHIRRDAQGKVYIAGIELKAGEGGGIADWILRQRRLVVRQATISWHDELRGAVPLQLQEVELLLRNRGRRHRFGMRAVPPQRLAGPLDVRGELIGKSTTAPADWLGALYVHVDRVDIDAWQPWMPVSMRHPKGAGAVTAWARFRGSRVTEVIADVHLADARARLARDLPELELAALSGRAQWKRSPDATEFSTTRLGFTTAGGATLKPADLALRLTGTEEAHSSRGELRANEIDLEPLAVLAHGLPFPEDVRQRLREFAPRGSLSDMELRWNGDWRAPRDYLVRGRFHELALKGHGAIPGFSGLSGTVEASEKSGLVHVDSGDLTFDMPRLFRDPLSLDHLVADIGWSPSETGPEFDLSKALFSNAHFAGTVSGRYRVVPGSRGVIDVSGKLTRADARHVARYVPLVIGEPTRAWLDEALVSGESTDVSLRLKGNLQEFPFANDKGGVFEVAAKVSGGVLAYATGWPRIENIAADVVFRGKQMEVTTRQATILGAQLIDVRARIPDLVVHYETLNIAGEAEGPSAEFLSFIEKSPVLGMIDRFTEGMHVEGNGRLALKLEIPLRAREKSKVSGVYAFAGNRFVADPAIPAVEQANGRIEFTESSVRVPQATAMFLGGPVTLSTADPGDATVRIDAHGRANIEGLRQSFGASWWSRHLRGAADWKGSLVLRRKLADLVIESNLQGIAADLPAPLGKAAADGVPLRLERRFISPAQQPMDEIDLSYGDVLSARLLRQVGNGKEAIRRGTIRFGGAAPQPERDGIWVSGVLKRLDVDGWLGLTGEESGPPSLDVAGIDVKLGEVLALNRDFHDIALDAVAEPGGWRASLSGRGLEGTALWQSEGHGKLTARMKELFIPAPVAQPVDHPSRPRRELPGLDVIAEQLQFKDKALGKLELLATPIERNWRIDKLRVTNPDGVLTGNGLVQNQLSQPRTRASVQLQASDIGKLLSRLGYPEGVRRGTATLAGTLAWPGGPLDFDYAALAGNLQLEAAKGQFVRLEPGIGKLLGILSLQALPRRITLDFRDIFSEGLAFDRIRGDVRIERGIAATDNFLIQGPSAVIAMHGKIDLAQETQDLRVRVVPSVSDSVSIAGALLGGPVAGVAAFLAQKVLKDPLGQIIAYEYNITGTWSEPQVSKVERGPPAERETP